MAGLISDEDVSLYKDEFSKAAAEGDGSGSVSTSKLGDVLKAVSSKVKSPVTEEQLQGMINEKGIETINFDDFLEMLKMALDRKRVNAEIRQMFSFYDRNGDGHVSQQEFREAMKQVGVPISDQEIEEVINNADKDADGNMKYEEFAEWYKNF